MLYKLKRIIKVGGLVGITAATSLYASRCVADYAYDVKQLPVNSAFNYEEMLRTDSSRTTYDGGLGLALGSLAGLCVVGAAGIVWALVKLNSGLEDKINH